MVGIGGPKPGGAGYIPKAPGSSPAPVQPGSPAKVEGPTPSSIAPQLPDAKAKDAIGGAKSGPALSNGTAPQVGNAFSMRLGLMTGSQKVSSTNDALAQLKAALESGQVPTSLPLSALDQLPIPPSGLALQLDGAKVAGQHVVIRKIVDPQEGPGLEVRFKLRDGKDMRAVEDQIHASGGGDAVMLAEKMNLDEQGRYVIDPSGTGYKFQAASTGSYSSSYSNTPAQSAVLNQQGRYEVGILDDSAAQAVRGLVRLRVFEGGDAKNLNASLAEALEKSGLSEALAPSTDDSRARLNQLRVLWQRDPKRAQELAEKNLEGPAAQVEIDAALKAAGVEPKDAAALEVKEVFPGHFTTIDPTQGERYKELGVEYIFAGVRKLDSVVAILGGDGLMSTNERYGRGMIIAGASSAADIGTGGADYVFTRMVTKDAKGTNLSSSYGSGDYQLVYGTDVLNRTDWFAYNKDNYGTTKDLAKFTGRQYGAELVESLKTGSFGRFAYNNEVMFQRGLSNQDVSAIFTATEQKKKALVDALTAKGLTEIGGKPLDEAIQVRTKMVD